MNELLYRELINTLIGYMEGVAIGMRDRSGGESAIETLCRAADTLEAKARRATRELHRIAGGTKGA